MRFIFKTDYDQDIRLIKHGGQTFWYAVLGLALVAAPWVLSNAISPSFSLIAIYGIVGLGLMVLSGYTDLISIGHAAFPRSRRLYRSDPGRERLALPAVRSDCHPAGRGHVA